MEIIQATEKDFLNIIELTKHVFDQSVGTEYSQFGKESFYEYLELEAFQKRINENHFILIAREDELVIGLIEVRNFNHISLFFVDSEYQRKGIGKKLFEEALKLIKNKIQREFIDVNSSKIAIPVYEKLGFKADGEEQEENGIKYTPMKYILNRQE